MPFVRVAPQCPDQRETAPLFWRNGAHAENLIRTYSDAVLPAFAAVAVDHRPEDSCFLRALCRRVIHGFVSPNPYGQALTARDAKDARESQMQESGECSNPVQVSALRLDPLL